MVQFMTEVRDKRMQKERSHTLKERHRILVQVLDDYGLTRPIDEPMPGAADIYHLENFRSVVEDTPIDVTVTAESFGKAMDEFPALCEQWRKEKAQELQDILQKHPEGKKATLELATTTFEWSVPFSFYDIGIVLKSLRQSLVLSENLVSSCPPAQLYQKGSR
jgi:hypothetical protein